MASTPSEQGLERELDRLYGLPPGEFTSARDELAKRLRSEGERERAGEIKKLRKPTASVWLVNRLVRERELDLQRLLKAGESLAQSSSPDGFREARRNEHEALERLAGAARELAGREGVGATAVDRALQTLRAGSLTDEGRTLLKGGRLTEELEPPGLEALTGLPAAEPRRPAKKAKTTGDETDRRRALERARRELRALETRARELDSAARTAGRKAARAESEAARLRRAAEEAQAEADEAGKPVADAKAEVERLRGRS